MTYVFSQGINKYVFMITITTTKALLDINKTRGKITQAHTHTRRHINNARAYEHPWVFQLFLHLQSSDFPLTPPTPHRHYM